MCGNRTRQGVVLFFVSMIFAVQVSSAQAAKSKEEILALIDKLKETVGGVDERINNRAPEVEELVEELKGEKVVLKAAEAKRDAKEVRNDFLVPNSPAFAALGITPEEIDEPTSARDFVLSLLNGVDANGNLQSGVAIEFAPYYSLVGKDLKLEVYRRSLGTRILSRARVSLATAKGTSDDDKAVRAAVGLRLPLLDMGDIRKSKTLDDCLVEQETEAEKSVDKILDLQERIAQVGVRDVLRLEGRIRAVDEPTESELEGFLGKVKSIEKALEGLEADVIALHPSLEELENKAWADCLEEQKKADWNASNFTLGIDGTAFGEDGSFDDFEGEGFSAYATAAYGFENIPGLEDSSQLILHARYRKNDQQALGDGSGGFREQDTLVLGGQLRIGAFSLFEGQVAGADTALYFEGDYIRADVDGAGIDKSYRFVGGLDLKLTKTVSFTVAIGGETGKKTNTDAAFVVGDLKLGF